MPVLLDYRSEVIALFESGNLEEILQRLTNYARSEISNHTWMSVFGGPTPSGKEAEDFVMDTIVAVLRGKAGEDGPKVHIGIEAWLKGKVRAAISNRMNSVENRGRLRTDEEGTAYENVREEIVLSRDAVAATDLERALEPVLDELIESVKDDKEVIGIFECLMDGVYKREEIAEGLKISPSAVTNAQKRLKRKQQEFAEKNKGRQLFQELT